MSTILIIIVVILLLGGGGGYYASNAWGPGGGMGVIGFVLVICLIIWLVQGRIS